MISWSDEALSDLARLEAFLRPKSGKAADRVVDALLVAPLRLSDHPRAGERIERTGDIELRRIYVDNYEMQYEVLQGVIRIARIFHMREER
jgi:plasmid stabilization system protein ParE